MAEPILGVGGFIGPPDDYFEVAVGIARKYGGVFICDEVQTGFGRTGEKWFGIEHSGVEPDIMTMAKGIANGLPVGATIAKSEIADTFTKPSICTFGGNPISMAAASATLKVMVRENMPALAKEKGQIIKNTLDELYERFSIVGEVRGRGLMWGLELVRDRATKTPAPEYAMRVLEAAKSEGLLLGKGGLYGNVIRMAPPMLIEKRDLEIGCDLLVRTFEKVCGAANGSPDGRRVN
jgi:4-aminobutyrate aminotransferase-like enzyme